jgi:hypothetical protein
MGLRTLFTEKANVSSHRPSASVVKTSPRDTWCGRSSRRCRCCCSAGAVKQWLTASNADALALQRPAPDEAIEVLPKSTRR